jgi:hypothetical protein
MASFAPIPDVPLEGLNLAESSLFKALKENVEILTGARTNGVRALTSDGVTIQATNNQDHPRVTAGAQGYATSYPNGATLAAQTGAIVIVNSTDYANLVQDVQNVMNDLAKVQNALNSLIGQLRS